MTAVLKPMDPDDFLVWCLDQEDRYELVGGYPIKMMTGARRGHDRMVVNLIVALDKRLRPPCAVATADLASVMLAGNIRRPDVTVECGPADPRELRTSEPTVFFEVLSPSTRAFDLFRKPDEYKQISTLKHIVAVDPDLPRGWVLSRDGAQWDAGIDIMGLAATVELPAIGIMLPMSEIYRGVVLEETF